LREPVDLKSVSVDPCLRNNHILAILNMLLINAVFYRKQSIQCCLTVKSTEHQNGNLQWAYLSVLGIVQE
jgi:hypothetical protein